MKKILALMALVLAVSGFVPVRAYNDDRLDWYCFQKDPFRRGMAYGGEELKLPISTGWEVQHGQKPVGTILISKNMAIVTGEKGLVAAYSIIDGSPIWRRDFGQPLNTEGTIIDDVMICCLPGGRIVGLDTMTGGSIWENTVIGDVVTPPVPYLSNFYISTTEKKLATISAISGYIYSQIDLKSKLTTPLTLQTLGDYETGMIAISEDSMLLDWEFYGGKAEMPSKVEGKFTLPVITASETLILSDDTGKLMCTDSKGSKQYWLVDMAGQIANAPCLFVSGIYVAAATKNGNIKAVQIGNGRVVWETKAKGSMSQPLISIGQNVIALTDSGLIQVLSSFDGASVSELNVGEPIVTPASYSTNSLFVGTGSGKIVCARSASSTYKFTISEKIVVAAPGTEKPVELKLEGVGNELFYINALGFPCRCKINRTFTPETVIRPNGSVTMKLAVDPTAPSAVYDVQIELRDNAGTMTLRQSLTIIVAKPEELLKPKTDITYPSDNLMMLKVGYSNVKFGRTFAGVFTFDKTKLKFKSASIDPILQKLIDSKSAYQSIDSSTPGRLVVFYSSKDTIPESSAVFDLYFDVLASAEDKFTFVSMSRATNGYPLPAEPMTIPYSAKFIQTEHVVKLQIGNLTASIDGKETKLKVAPYINSGKTMVPLRFVGEALGSEVLWTQADRSVVYKNTLPTGAREIKLWIGKTMALVDGKETAVKPAPEIKNGNTCVGLSFVSANFGCKTEWDAATKTVTIKFLK
jgi:outer membrane protein assembly factor BamB